MVFFDLSFKSMLIEDIVEDKVSLWTYGRISWLSINRGFYEVNKVHVFMVPFVLASAYHGEQRIVLGGGISSVWLVFRVFDKKNQKSKNRNACRHTFFLRMKVRIAN